MGREEDMPTKKPLRKILRSEQIGPHRYRAIADTGMTFIVEYSNESDGWRWYHDGDDPRDPQGSNDSGFWTQRDCLESLRDYLATVPPAMFIPSLGLVTSA